MIVYQDNDSFTMTKQHDHAKLSKEVAEWWNEELFLGVNKRKSVLLAIENHDRAWIDVDESPIWNDLKKVPYSFIDYPLSLKLPFYSKGISEIESMDSYAALLCSIHYTSFFSKSDDDYIINEFVNKEIARQKLILEKLNLDEDDNELSFHYQLLKLCDNLSLFICMQESGATGEEVHDWFKKGIPQTFHFLKEGNLNVEWKTDFVIAIDPFPFKSEFDLSIPLRQVPKKLIEKLGVLHAFKMTTVKLRNVRILAR